MLSTEFEILTPLSKLHRISRQISDRDTFAIEPGMWVKLDAEGRVANYVLDNGTGNGSAVPVAPKKEDVVELCINSAVSGALSVYEGNDTKVGNITTILEPGVRVAIGAGLLLGTLVVGDKVAINAAQDLDVNASNVVGSWKKADTNTMVVGIVTGVKGDMTEIRLIEPIWQA